MPLGSRTRELERDSGGVVREVWRERIDGRSARRR